MTVVKLSGLLAAERTIAAIARGQHGVVSRGQLLAAGIGREIIDNRVEAEWLRPIHRGVYLVGPTEGKWAREMAAALASGNGAVVSHRNAASLWNLLSHPARDHTVEVTVPAPRAPRRQGIRVHRTNLRPDEVTKVSRIPVTTPARTLLDLAAEGTLAQLEHATAKALATHLTSRRKLLALIARYPRRHGAPRLGELVDGRPAMTRADTEVLLLGLIRRARLPTPDLNVMMDTYEVDFLWREQRLIVETDGFEFHSSRQQFESDRRRDAELAARGFTVIRITWRQLVDEPEAGLVRLARALARRAP
jgi:very-short-patch-repair endonuclease